MNYKNDYPARDPTGRPTRTSPPVARRETNVAVQEATREIIREAPREVMREDPHSKTPERSRRKRWTDAREAVSFPIPRVLEKWARLRTARLAVLCLLIGVGAGLLLLPAIQSARGNKGDDDHLGGGIPSGGTLPSVGWPFATETESQTETKTETYTETEIYTETQTETQTESETQPETEWETAPVVIPPIGAETETEFESDFACDTEAVTETEIETETEMESEIEAETEAVTETETETEAETETETETMPSGAYVVVKKDLSEPNRSIGYIQCTANQLPPSIPGEGTRLWNTVAAPTVLLVHSHPYEGYHDGRDWYDPATGPFAQTDALGTSDGVVGLGVELTGILREAGVNVIHLRVPIGAGESTSDIYDRTEEAVRHYCEMYPEIGLVIDLRRSAELTDEGEIVRTWGNYEGEDCAQVRLSVSGDRATDRVSLDIAVAVSLRRALWAEAQSISRPVLVKGGSGMAGELARVAILTIDLGSAGNSFQEAQHLLAPLGDAIADLVLAP